MIHVTFSDNGLGVIYGCASLVDGYVVEVAQETCRMKFERVGSRIVYQYSHTPDYLRRVGVLAYNHNSSSSDL